MLCISGCSSTRFIHYSNNTPALRYSTSNYGMPNWQQLNVDEIYQYCLEQDKLSFNGRVLLLACSNQLLSSKKLGKKHRAYALSTYNESLTALITPIIDSKQEQQITHGNLKINLIGKSSDHEKTYLSSQLSVIDPSLHFKIFGEIGVSGVVFRQNTVEGLDTFYPQEGIFRPITFTFDSLTKKNNFWELNLKSHQTSTVDSVNLADNSYQLKYSPSAAYLTLLEQANIDDLSWVGLINASSAEDRRGIFAIDEISETKIPIVMTHGLNSDPLIWRYLTLAILNDEQLHNTYQIWHAYYPSGPPPFYNAMMLRHNLNQLLEKLPLITQQGTGVFIGHSLGGIISKTMSINTGYKLWDVTFTERPETLLKDIDNQKIKDIFIFDSVFKKNKVFFLDTPHQGSTTADSFIGHLGSALVTLPETLLGLFRKFIQRIGTDKITESMLPFLIDYGPDSVQVLRPGHPLIMSINTLKIQGDVFSVIGSNGKLSCKTPYQCSDITDGTVPYFSAHNDQAVDEVIVSSNHDSYKNQQAINFILEHLR